LSLLTWISAGAIAVIILCIVWPGSPLHRPLHAPGERVRFLRTRVTGTDIVFYSGLIIAMLAGVVIPVLAPETAFAAWMNREKVLLPYWGTCIAVTAAARMVFGTAMLLRADSHDH